jgi:hypothetical protein
VLVLVVDFFQKLNVGLQVLEHALDLPGVDFIKVPVIKVDLFVEGIDQVLKGVPDILHVLCHANLVMEVHDLGVLNHLHHLINLVVVLFEQLDFLELLWLERDLVFFVQYCVLVDELFELVDDSLEVRVDHLF